MIGLILAAGKGKRLARITNNLPKSYLMLGNKRLLDHQIDSLQSIGINNIVIVAGFQSAVIVRDYATVSGINIVKNPFYDRTNVLASVWFAREYLNEGFFFMHADTYFEPSILRDLQSTSGEIVLSVETKASCEEEMKVIIEGGLIKRIGKDLPVGDSFGEFTGLAKIEKTIAPQLLETICLLTEDLAAHDAYFEASLQSLIDDGVQVHYLDIGSRLSIEIDYPEDYQRALKHFDAIQARGMTE